ncbi:hypothetical protein WL76_18020 [Burkholderia ubonensis]|uniref:Uncharacterized protein n=1 Tax=Burkholderia ubonensis TaxID=101571 RepID=A0A108CEY6_9BURK|nr:hypothetical protein [Burkholderia ubonensis]KWE51354.1 hypothetical protein WL76_18020 [Burkholderia ubonensis]KWE71118.1 hypothetical protein WL77_10515 [Burkholderia ubonensis]KWE76725.1 hypothetical protein WL79_09695 [Burkholderia ubonensis]KWK73379.1 hypothetical protein WM16_16425 [Burkholderia ubonensis]
MAPRIRYQVNVCGGDFEHVRNCFRQWKKEPLAYRKDRLMFEGQNEVRILSGRSFHDTEQARHALEQACRPYDPYALAAEVHVDSRNLWIVMAAYEE